MGVATVFEGGGVSVGFVELEKRGRVGVLTINRPEALNALSSQVLTELDAMLDVIAADSEVDVVVPDRRGPLLRGRRRYRQMKEFSAIDGKRFGVHGGNVFLKLENMAKAVIAAINGFALGGGCELSMACDIRLASEKAKFGQPEVGLRHYPPASAAPSACPVSWALPRPWN